MGPSERPDCVSGRGSRHRCFPRIHGPTRQSLSKIRREWRSGPAPPGRVRSPCAARNADFTPALGVWNARSPRTRYSARA